MHRLMERQRAEHPEEYRTWADLLAAAAEGDLIIARAPEDAAVWEQLFYADFGGDEGVPVLAWSERWVYFPVNYDGQQYFARAPRHPQADGQRAVGGADRRR